MAFKFPARRSSNHHSSLVQKPIYPLRPMIPSLLPHPLPPPPPLPNMPIDPIISANFFNNNDNNFFQRQFGGNCSSYMNQRFNGFSPSFIPNPFNPPSINTIPFITNHHNSPNNSFVGFSPNTIYNNQMNNTFKVIIIC
ncbi:hypothetical protein BLA29_011203 [Euroglyphus maynei]|uniref:Uncharacterized protein n=1 Tax=Euroglyphus maynei TaxID=6958 RepID=A0A1Y3B111_EURMA|nr:hypothetical protein BLA29_011203 [Euroglyphus maynei]